MKKPTPAQLRARKLFAERAKAGTLRKGTHKKRNPLKSGRGKKTISENIRKEVLRGHPVKVAAAMAYRKARASKGVTRVQRPRNPAGGKPYYYIVALDAARVIAGYFTGHSFDTLKSKGVIFPTAKDAKQTAMNLHSGKYSLAVLEIKSTTVKRAARKNR